MAARKSRLIKASLIIDADLHARWSACASLRNVPRNAIAVDALEAALKGIVCFDRLRKSDRSTSSNRVTEDCQITSEEENPEHDEDS